MKIRKISIKNFKCIIDLVMDNIPDIVVIAGPNGSGKSALLEAIGIFKENIGTYYTKGSEPNAVKVNADFAEIEIGFKITKGEKKFLMNTYNIKFFKGGFNVDDLLFGKVKILKNGIVKVEKIDEGLDKLLKYFDLDSDVGIMEYIGPYRKLPQKTITNISLGGLSHQQEKTFRFFNIDEKFNQLKEYLTILELKGLQEFRNTGRKVDYLVDIKELFRNLFEPKEFEGVEIAGSQVNFWVKTPWGKHDIDYLSSGEKEILMVFADLHKLNIRNSIVLYDEPELHLNAALEGKIVNQLRKIGENNQFFLATHSTEVIGSVPYEELFQINFYKEGNQIKRISDEREKIDIFKALGANVNLQLISEKVVFVEGKSDKEILETLFPEYKKTISFIKTQGLITLMEINQRITELLREASKYSSFYCIRDKDFLEESEIIKLQKKYNNRLHVWKRYHIENYLLVPELILSILQDLHIPIFKNAKAVEIELKRIADGLKEHIIANWINCELNRKICNYDFKVGGDEKLEEKMVDRALKQLKRIKSQLSETAIKQQFIDKSDLLKKHWDKELWKVLCPGKDILTRFSSRYVKGVSYLPFRNLLVNKIKEQNKIPEEFKAVINFILKGN